MKNWVSAMKLIQIPTSIGMMWISSSSRTAGRTSRYGVAPFQRGRRRLRGGDGGEGGDGGVIPTAALVGLVVVTGTAFSLAQRRPGHTKQQPAGDMVHAGHQPAAAILSCAACIAVLISLVVTFLPVAASASRPLTALPTLVSNSDSAGTSGSGTALVARTAANASASTLLSVKFR